MVEKQGNITAIIAYNDMIAWSIYESFQNKGIQIPEDISLVGFDNLRERIKFPIDLSSISLSRDVARFGVEVLLKKIKREIPGDEYVHKIIDPQLYEGKTVKHLIQ